MASNPIRMPGSASLYGFLMFTGTTVQEFSLCIFWQSVSLFCAFVRCEVVPFVSAKGAPYSGANRISRGGRKGRREDRGQSFSCLRFNVGCSKLDVGVPS